jgi:CheY-like chemotaxis protein
VIGGKVTDFLDLPAGLKASNVRWSSEDSIPVGAPLSVLVADASAFSRGLARNYLELAGHPVLEAVSEADALDKLDRNRVSAVVMSRNLLTTSGKQFVELMRGRPGLTDMPVVELCDSHSSTNGGDRDEFDAHLERFDRVGLLNSLKQLSTALQEKEDLSRDQLTPVEVGR